MLREAAIAVLVPAVTAGTALVLAGRRAVVAPLAIAGAYGAGHVLVRRAPLPVRETTDWLFFVAVAGGLLGAAVALLGGAAGKARGRALRGGAALLVAAGVAWTASGPNVEWTWTTAEAALWLGAITVGTAVAWGSLEAIAARLSARAFALAAMLLAGALAGLLASTGSALLGFLAASLAGALGAAWVAALVRPGTTLGRGTAAPVALLLCALWVNGHFYAETPLSSAAAFLVLPVGALAAARRG